MSSNTKPEDTKVASQMPIAETTKVDVKPMLNAAVKPVDIDKKKAMPGVTDSFIKNLFQTVQGVKHDALCPHGLPYYACMSCSH